MTCSKMAFASKADARAYVRGSRKFTRNNVSALKGTIHYYHCRHCGQVHLTSMSKTEYRKKRRTNW